MNCEDFESNVNDLAREDMTEAALLAQAIAHSEEWELALSGWRISAR